MSIFQTIIGNRFFRYLTSFLINDDRRIFDSTVSLMALLPMEITGILWISLFAGFYHDVLFYIFIFMIIMQLWFYLVVSKVRIDTYASYPKIHVSNDVQHTMVKDHMIHSDKNHKKTILACISHVLYSIGSATMMYCALQHYFGMNIIYSILLSLILILVNIVLCGIMFIEKYERKSILGYFFCFLFRDGSAFQLYDISQYDPSELSMFFQREMYSLSHIINIITISIFGILFVKSILPDFFKKYLKTNVVKYVLFGKYITYVSLSLLLFAFVVTLGLGLVMETPWREDRKMNPILPKPKVVIDVWKTKDINFASLRQLLTKLGAKSQPPTSEELKPLWDAMETLCQGWSTQTISKFKQQLGENEAYYVDQEQVYCKHGQENDWKRNNQYSRANGHCLMLQVLNITTLASLYYVLDLNKKEVVSRVLSFNQAYPEPWEIRYYTYAMPYGSTLSTTAESLIKSLVNKNLEYNTAKSAELDLFKSNMKVLCRRKYTDSSIATAMTAQLPQQFLSRSFTQSLANSS